MLRRYLEKTLFLPQLWPPQPEGESGHSTEPGCGSQAAANSPKTVPELFEAQAVRTPEAVALIFDDQCLTYGALNSRANRLAHYLRAQSIGPETIVGIALERSIEMVVAVLASLKAGAAYLPLDPNYPKDRLAFMIEDANAPLLITRSALLGRLPAHRAQVVQIDVEWPRIEQSDAANPENQLDPQNPAYVIYTSGSTGTPKGVVISHSAIASKLSADGQEFGVGPQFRIPFYVSTAFDPSVIQILLPLVHGAAIVVISDAVRGSPARFWEEICRSEANWISFNPSVLTALNVPAAEASHLEHIILGGEQLKREFASELVKRFKGARITNRYGPTEATVDVIAHVVQAGESGAIPIGRPLENHNAYVLDEGLQPVPIGVSGELYIAGAGLARGYLNRPGLTAQRFIACPFGPPGARMYRTGDLARWRAEGILDFLGRSDQQIKIRGFRIEPGEIEAALSAIEEVGQAVVTPRDFAGENRLVAYLVPRLGMTLPGADTLRATLAAKLPEYMLPSAFITMDALPLTPNGKLDCHALPEPDLAGKAAYRAPRDARETLLCALFAEFTGAARVGLDDNFFHLGGHSLLAMRFISRLRQETGLELPLRRVFEHPTPESLAAILADPARDEAAPPKPGSIDLPECETGEQHSELVESLRKTLQLGTCNWPGSRKQPDSLIVKFRSGATENPFFWCGNSLNEILALLPHLREGQPTYGLRTMYQIADITSQSTRALAELYVDEIISIQPNGPYRLGGYCLGGVVCFEIARQLIARGHVVDSLIMAEVRPELDGPLAQFVRYGIRAVGFWRFLHEHNPDRSIFYYVYRILRKTAKKTKRYVENKRRRKTRPAPERNAGTILSYYKVPHYSGHLSLLLCEDSELANILRLKARFRIARLIFRPANFRKWTTWKDVQSADVYLLAGTHATGDWLNTSEKMKAQVLRLSELINVCLQDNGARNTRH